MESLLLDAARHRRSPATTPGYHHGRAPRNKGLRYPADPPTIEEIIAVMRAAGDEADGARLRALIVICGAQACGSAKRLPRPRPTSTVRAGRCSFAAARAAADARSAWAAGMESTRTMATDPIWASDRGAPLRDPRREGGPSLGAFGCSQATTTNGGTCDQAQLRDDAVLAAAGQTDSQKAAVGAVLLPRISGRVSG